MREQEQMNGTLYTLLIVVHVSSLIALVSASLIHIIGHGLRGEQAVTVQELGAKAGRVWASAGGGILLLTGIILTSISDDTKVGWGKLWIWASIVLWLIATLTSSVLSARLGRQMVAQLRSGDAAVAATESRLLTFAWANLAITVAIIALMFFKPGA